MLDQPLVSVILTSYNRPRFLPEAIECVLEQDYGNLGGHRWPTGSLSGATSRRVVPR
jgi:hypothetical protein